MCIVDRSIRINGRCDKCFSFLSFLIESFVVSSLFALWIEVSRIESKRNNYSRFNFRSVKSVPRDGVIGAGEPSKSVNLGVYRAVRFPRQSAIAVAVST